MILKEELIMITFTVLLIAVVALAIAAALIFLVGGTGILLAFGDLFVCGFLIWLIVRIFRRRR
jgi:hypothetical protein